MFCFAALFCPFFLFFETELPSPCGLEQIGDSSCRGVVFLSFFTDILLFLSPNTIYRPQSGGGHRMSCASHPGLPRRREKRATYLFSGDKKGEHEKKKDAIVFVNDGVYCLFVSDCILCLVSQLQSKVFFFVLRKYLYFCPRPQLRSTSGRECGRALLGRSFQRGDVNYSKCLPSSLRVVTLWF